MNQIDESLLENIFGGGDIDTAYVRKRDSDEPCEITDSGIAEALEGAFLAGVKFNDAIVDSEAKVVSTIFSFPCKAVGMIWDMF